MDDVSKVSREELACSGGADDVSRSVVFDDENVLVVQSRVPGGVTTGWHHNGDRRVFGYVVSGHASMEYGPGGIEALDLDAGDYIHVPPQTVRRIVNPTEQDWVVVISFVGSGPPAVPVDGPSPGDAPPDAR